MKHKELFKTVILTLLIISSVILSSKILFSKELWSDDYNSFHIATNSDGNFFTRLLSIFKKENAKALDYSQIFFPKQFLIYKESKASLITPNSDSYNFFNDNLKLLLQGVFNNASYEEISEEDFKKACRTPSVFIDFYNPISFQMLGDYYGATITSNIMEMNNIKHILLSLSNDSKNIIIYVKNNYTGASYKITFSGDLLALSNKVDDILKKIDPSNKSYSYAFENSFDVHPTEEQKPLKLLLDSYMIINITQNTLPQIYPETLVDVSGTYDENLYTKITQIFGMNINSARRFTDSNGTVNFVENFATLKFHKNGLMEFSAVNAEKGISLKNDMESDYDTVKSVGTFFESVNVLFSKPENNEFVFNKIIRDSNNIDQYTITFDILYKGVPVLFKKTIGDTQELNSSISIVVENGKIISYKQYFIGFKQSNSNLANASMINALDEFYSVYDTESNRDLTINDMYNIYSLETTNNLIELKWAVSLSNDEIVIVSPKI